MDVLLTVFAKLQITSFVFVQFAQFFIAFILLDLLIFKRLLHLLQQREEKTIKAEHLAAQNLAKVASIQEEIAQKIQAQEKESLNLFSEFKKGKLGSLEENLKQKRSENVALFNTTSLKITQEKNTAKELLQQKIPEFANELLKKLEGKKILFIFLLISLQATITKDVFAASKGHGGEHSPSELIFPTINLLILLIFLWVKVLPALKSFFKKNSQETKNYLLSAQERLEKSLKELESAENSLKKLPDLLLQKQQEFEKSKQTWLLSVEKEFRDKNLLEEQLLQTKEDSFKNQAKEELISEILEEVLTHVKKTVSSSSESQIALRQHLFNLLGVLKR